MVIANLLSWWYSHGWQWLISSFGNILKDINNAFSIPILLRTWFSPWKQIQTPSTFRNFFQSAIDNLISRFVGAAVRTGMIIGALVASIATMLLACLSVVIWPLLPLSIIILPILFLGGVSL